MRTAVNTAIVLLLIATTVLLLLLISSFDRAREASVKLEARLTALSIRRMGGSRHRGVGDFANMNFFSPEAVDGGVLIQAIASEPPGLNPLLHNEATAMDIFALCSMTLAERDWENPETFRPALAESYTISPDHKTYRIKLRRGVMWHPFTDPETGVAHPAKEVTAHDIKFTIDIIRNPQTNCEVMRVYYRDLQSVEVINDYELVITWSKAYYGSLAQTLGLFPMPRHFYMPDGEFDPARFNDDHKRNRMIVGCGPYMFHSWESSKRIRLERNPDYIGFAYGAAPPIETRIFEVIALPNTRLQSLLAGKISMLGLSAEQWMNRTHSPEFTSGAIAKLRYPDYFSYSYIGYNNKIHCFRDAATRRALTMLINRQEILDRLLYGCGTISKGPIIPTSSYSDQNLQPWPYDPEKAKALLAQAGWFDRDGDGILERDGQKFSFTMLMISGSTTQQRMLLMIQNDLAAAGIEMKLQTVEWSVLLQRLKNQEFEACNLGWRTGFDPDLYQLFHSSQSEIGGDNFISYRNPEVDRLIEELRQEFDMKKRIAMFHQLERIIHEDQPYTFLFCSDALLAYHSNIDNIRVFATGIESLSFYINPGE